MSRTVLEVMAVEVAAAKEQEEEETHETQACLSLSVPLPSA